MPVYILRVTLNHPTFRIPSLLSIGQTYGFEIKFLLEDLYRGILLVELEKDEDAVRLLERGILVMSASRLLAQGSTYEELHADARRNMSEWEPYLDSTYSWSLEGINHRVPGKRQLESITSFVYIDLRSHVDLKNPEVQYVIYEDYDVDDETSHMASRRMERDGQFRHAYVGKYLGSSVARSLIMQHSVKTRTYYGNTAMEAEMGFLMACQALPLPGKIVYDPFVGTGSMLYSCAHWGATVFGSDIDARQMRGKKNKGKGMKPGIKIAAAQYGVEDNILDCLNFDVTRGPWRRGGWVDAIVTDPPYGVRAGAKRLGKRHANRPLAEQPHVLPNGELAHMQEDYLPPCKPYEMVDLTLDLVLLARWLLVPGGRLVFFLPTISEEFDALDVPVVEGMRELKVGEGSVQDFGKWGRRLITMEKTATDDGQPPSFGADQEEYERLRALMPGHHKFADKYMNRFQAPVLGADHAGA